MNEVGRGFEGVPAESVLALLLAFDDALQAADTATTSAAAAVIARAAAAAVPGADQASVSADRRGALSLLAASGAMAAAADGIQRESRCGPAVSALGIAGLYCTGDVDTDARWPVFASQVRTASGVVSVMALPLYRDPDVGETTALCLYSTRPHAFDDTAQAVAAALARPAARVLEVATHRDRTWHLQRALASNREIGTAMGILMATRKVTREHAFTLLRDASQRGNRKLADIATRVVDIGMLDDPTGTPGDPRAHRPRMRSSIPA